MTTNFLYDNPARHRKHGKIVAICRNAATGLASGGAIG
jgi:hypothetical protein